MQFWRTENRRIHKSCLNLYSFRSGPASQSSTMRGSEWRWRWNVGDSHCLIMLSFGLVLRVKLNFIRMLRWVTPSSEVKSVGTLRRGGKQLQECVRSRATLVWLRPARRMTCTHPTASWYLFGLNRLPELCPRACSDTLVLIQTSWSLPPRIRVGGWLAARIRSSNRAFAILGHHHQYLSLDLGNKPLACSLRHLVPQSCAEWLPP